MTDNKELKRCPFCGAETEIKSINEFDEILYQVGCSNVHCKVIPITHCFGSEEAAIAVWNRRIV